MSKTIHETIAELHESLRDYVEATYHIGHPGLLAQRRALLDTPGVLSQVPYFESTPKYTAGTRFDEIEGLHIGALSAFKALAKQSDGLPKIIHEPAYVHQVEAIRKVLVEHRNIIVMTGTGSGKTESFLLPILGKLASEAQSRPESFRTPAMRSLILYPMNALVNDQLGRLRTMFGDERLMALFQRWAGRPARFARYTSRTPYAGVRTSKKDQRRLKSFENFFVDIEATSENDSSEMQKQAQELKAELKARGKWPAKEDLAAWYGPSGSRWQQSNGTFVRGVMANGDAELITRHEVQACPPDLLVTNYSMLEYMLMRPVERSIFDKTCNWLKDNPQEKFLVVLDEAHLYRGAAGAEVGLLLRRLRDRLQIGESRFQVICATASFQNRQYAPEFGAKLAGVATDSFDAITGILKLAPDEQVGSEADAEALAKVDVRAFVDSDESVRRASVEQFLAYRGQALSDDIESSIYSAMNRFGPLNLLVNRTMKEAVPLKELSTALFPTTSTETADIALTTLLALASSAKEPTTGLGLLPCRVHSFFRGLPGLWVCLDPRCTSVVNQAHKSDVCGKMYSQPRETCSCGSRVFEFFTCRNCGSAYARAYTDSPHAPSVLWSEPGRKLRMSKEQVEVLQPIDILLEAPIETSGIEPADLDLETGRLNPAQLGLRTRTVYLKTPDVAHTIGDSNEDGDDDDGPTLSSRLFVPCGVCGTSAAMRRTSIQNHQTKGDQPFQALVARQIQVQPPSAKAATAFAPLRGRKVLVFSDSRQVAARLAPNLQMYSTRDSLRPLMLWGLRALSENEKIRQRLSINDVFLAVLLGAVNFSVRLRPELGQGETFSVIDRVERAVRIEGALTDPLALQELWMDLQQERIPAALLDDIYTTIGDKHYGLESLGLASISERQNKRPFIIGLPQIPGVATSDEEKLELVRAWLRTWQRKGFWMTSMPANWWLRSASLGISIQGVSATNKSKAIEKILVNKDARKVFFSQWLPVLNREFADDAGDGKIRLAAKNITLKLDGNWVMCRACKSVHRPVSTIKHCLNCSRPETVEIDPNEDQVFRARKGYYRRSVEAALQEDPIAPISLIAAEHTAQLNSAQNDSIFSKAEENELAFQDVEMQWGSGATRQTAIDVLSSTTTMEVGIDIGALSGVALRNMPPSRSNYQQRAGRAGRRGNAVATVIAFGSADSHDEHYFSKPDEMIRGPVIDPSLTLDNAEIATRHIRAWLLQNYHQAKLPRVDSSQDQSLFSVLGSVSGFKGSTALLNRKDFEQWLRSNESLLKVRVASWLPESLDPDTAQQLMQDMIADCLKAIDDALAEIVESETDTQEDDDETTEVPDEEGSTPSQLGRTSMLLDRLLYCGVLPRYAFPTDVATFSVFNRELSTGFRHVLRFAPSQSLPVALSQYAPGKQVWISGKCYESGAIYSTMRNDRKEAYANRRLYRECSICGFADTKPVGLDLKVKDVSDCSACGSPGTFGPARYWLRPPGFAHPIDTPEVTSPDDLSETSYATRAKLTMKTPAHESASWTVHNERIKVLSDRQHLLVSNTGPDDEGYNYCTLCGTIESSTTPNSTLMGPHLKPYRDDDQTCPGERTARNLVLGTDFITDVALISMRVASPLGLRPGAYETHVALRTVSEALAKAACQLLELEPGELMAEYRPALTEDSAGRDGLEAEIFLYDTLPGGAGFSQQAGRQVRRIFELALSMLRECPEHCESSCYRCLRSFKNKIDHGSLDRHVGADLVSYLLDGVIPQFPQSRIDSAARVLLHDLERQAEQGEEFKSNVIVSVAGQQLTLNVLAQSTKGVKIGVCLVGPLMNESPHDRVIVEALRRQFGVELLLVNELLVRGNLPAASLDVIEALRR
jgi:ATP-dependent helicase YprA (DUF1998 family)